MFHVSDTIITTDARDCNHQPMAANPQTPESFYRLLADTSLDYAMFLMDGEGTITYWNPGARLLFGYEPEEVVGRNFDMLFLPEDVRNGIPLLELDQARTTGRGDDRRWHDRKDNSRFFADGVTTALRAPEGDLIGFAKIARDATDRKIADEKLEGSEARLRLLLEGVHEYAIYMLDPAGNVSSWNAGAQRLTGYTGDEVTGRHFSLFFPPEAVRAGAPAQALEIAARRGRYESESVRVRKDGTPFWAETYITPVRDPDQTLIGFAKVTRNVTDRKKSDQRLAIQSGVTTVLAGAEDLEAALPEVLERLARELDAEVANYWLIDAAAGVIRSNSSWRAPGIETGLSDPRTFTRGQGLPGRTWKGGRASWIEDITLESLERFPRLTTARQEGFRTAIAFPIVLQGKPFGVIEVFLRAELKQDDELIEVLNLVGSQIGHFIERRRAERLLRESEGRYRAIAEAASDAIFTINTESIVQYVNAAVTKVFGYQPEELIGRPLDVIIPKRLQEAHHHGMKRYTETGKRHIPWSGVELPGVHKDGHEIPLELSFGAFAEGERRFFTGFARDITERKRSEEERARLLAGEQEARHQAEEISDRLQRLLQVTDIALMHLSLEDMSRVLMSRLTGVMQCERSALLLLNDEKTALVLRAAQNMDVELQQGIQIPLGEGFAGRIAESGEPLVIDHNRGEDGRPHPESGQAPVFSMAGVPLKRGGEVIGVLHVGTSESRIFDDDDVRLLQLAADRIAIAIENSRLFAAERASRERMSFVAEASEILTSSLDYEGTLRQVAKLAVPRIADWCAVDLFDEAERTLKRVAVEHIDPGKAELIHRMQTLYPANLDSAEGVGKVVREKVPVVLPAISDEYLQRSASDEQHLTILRSLAPFSAVVVPMLIGERLTGVITFVTAESRRRMTDDDVITASELARRAAAAIENAELYRAAQEASRAKDDFMAMVSHELRTPMTAILGWAMMLKTDVDAETMAEAVSMIERSALTQAQLIEDILDTARVREGKLSFHWETVNLADVIEKAVKIVRVKADEKELILDVELDRTVPLIEGDPRRLQQVLLNLLSNSVKFTPAGAEIEVRLRREEEKAVITVCDTGPGIPPEFLPMLFRRFSQSESTRRRSQGGLGLGLSIAHHLVEMHGGTIRAESRGEGLGATFIVELPLTAVVRDR